MSTTSWSMATRFYSIQRQCSCLWNEFTWTLGESGLTNEIYLNKAEFLKAIAACWQAAAQWFIRLCQRPLALDRLNLLFIYNARHVGLCNKPKNWQSGKNKAIVKSGDQSQAVRIERDVLLLEQTANAHLNIAITYTQFSMDLVAP